MHDLSIRSRCGQKHDACWAFFGRGGRQDVQAIETGHGDIDHRNVWLKLTNGIHDRHAIAALRDNLDVGLRSENVRQPLQEHGVVVGNDEQYALTPFRHERRGSAIGSPCPEGVRRTIGRG